MSLSLLLTATIGFAGLLVLMTLTFLVGRAIRNYGIVDAVWSLQFIPLAAWYAWALDGDRARQLLLLVLVTVWSLRLGWHLATRIARAHPQEDRRYAALRAEWGSRADRRMFGFFLLQAAISLPLSLPILLAAADPAPLPDAGSLIGTAIVLLALLGEGIADAQLRRFKARTTRPGAICRDGLWGWSRHPNYFFEWLVWVGLSLFAVTAPWGALSLFAPALMLFLLLRVTGIPATEATAIASRGDAYRAYQRETSAFLPLPPRRHPSPQS